MKHDLMRCRLRLATVRAYDPLYAGTGKCVVEGSAEEYALDDPIDAQHGSEADADAVHEPGRAECLNPFRDEPSPTVVHAVQHFGVVGLVGCALGSGVLRWVKSLYH